VCVRARVRACVRVCVCVGCKHTHLPFCVAPVTEVADVWTCFDNGNRYRIAARMFITPDSSASNVGFRCAANALPDAEVQREA
jgi:hypothetical protein